MSEMNGRSPEAFLIGVMLVAEGLGQHIPRGYIYFGMGFALAVEALNMAAGKRRV